jgi:hypothetical protein
MLNTADYAAANGTSVTLSVGAALGDIVEIIAYTVSSVINVSPSPSGGSAGQVLYQSAANTTANTDVGTTCSDIDNDGYCDDDYSTSTIPSQPTNTNNGPLCNDYDNDGYCD